MRYFLPCVVPLLLQSEAEENKGTGTSSGPFQPELSLPIITICTSTKKQKWLSRLLLNNLIPQAVSCSFQTTRGGWLYPRSMKIHVHSKLKYLSNSTYLLFIKMDNLIFNPNVYELVALLITLSISTASWLDSKFIMIS